jgi:nitrile hydratase
MDGIHDLGGKHGFGRVDRRSQDSAFSQRWEAVVFALVNSLLGAGVARNIDHFRHAVERIDPVSYLNDGYYGRWLGGAETLLVEAGVLTQAEIDGRVRALGGPEDVRVAARPDTVATVEAAPGPAGDPVSGARRELEVAPRFGIGDRVSTVRAGRQGHTRLPAYVRGCVGEVRACHGGWVIPDSNAHGLGEQPQHLYTVAFAAEQLWGSECEDDTEVCVDLFEDYLMEVSHE